MHTRWRAHHGSRHCMRQRHRPRRALQKKGALSGRCAQVCARLRTLHTACRCLKFGEGPADLLAFSEHSDLCHLVDTRAFKEHQVSVPRASAASASNNHGLALEGHLGRAITTACIKGGPAQAHGCCHNVSWHVPSLPLGFARRQLLGAQDNTAQQRSQHAMLSGACLMLPCTCLQVLDLSAGCEGSSDSGLEEGCDISGLSFTPSGRRLYVGLEGVPGQGIAAFDVKMLSRLTFGAAQLN